MPPLTAAPSIDTFSPEFLTEVPGTKTYQVSSFDEFLANYDKLYGQSLENLVRKVVSAKANFGPIIDKINEDPDGLLLDHLKGMLGYFDEDYYQRTIAYITGDKLAPRIREYLVQAVEHWDTVSVSKRIGDLKSVLGNVNDSYLKSTIQETIAELEADG